MALDGIILYKVVEDLKKSLPIRINRISETSKTEIVFNVHANNIRTNLVMSFHSVYNHICLSNKNYTTYNDPSTFVMVLRKYLLNGIIYDIEQNNYDRYILMHIKALNDLYDEKEYLLSVELMGKYANLVLIDKENNKIIDALKKIPPYENNKRTILQGANFVLPEEQHKIDPFEIDEPNLDDSLVKQLQGFSKLLEKEVRYRLNNQSFKEIMQEIKQSEHLFLTEYNDTFEYHLIPLLHLGKEYQKYPIQEGFDELYYHLDEKERIKNITNDIYKFIKRQIKHYDSKIIKLNDSLNDALNLDEDRENGELLFTYSNINSKGLKEVLIEDYEGNNRLIKLDPKLSIKENANKYFQIYQKKRKGQEYLKEQINIAKMELEYFISIDEQLSLANLMDAMDIKNELSNYGYFKKINTNKKKKKKINLYQVRYKDYTITFGKNNIQNNYLTFTYAKSNYMWFHAQKYHGCHLVIDSENPDEDAIRVCANLAAYYSKGRYSSSVPVDYTLVKNIKKISGAKSGFVSLRHQKTIYIDPYEDKQLNITAI